MVARRKQLTLILWGPKKKKKKPKNGAQRVYKMFGRSLADRQDASFCIAGLGKPLGDPCRHGYSLTTMNAGSFACGTQDQSRRISTNVFGRVISTCCCGEIHDFEPTGGGKAAGLVYGDVGGCLVG